MHSRPNIFIFVGEIQKMLIASNNKDELIKFKHYDHNISVMGQSVHDTISVGKINLHIVGARGGVTEQSPGNFNLITLVMNKNMRKIAEKEHAWFAQMDNANNVERTTILVAHQETEDGYEIDRVQQSFAVHAYYVSSEEIDMFGSQFPEMYNTNVPLIRIFSTHKETGVIKETIYYSDSLSPRVYYTEPGSPKYDKLASLRRPKIFVILYDGMHFATKMWVKPFTKVIVNKAYLDRINILNYDDAVNHMNYVFHGGMPSEVPDGMITIMDDDINKLKEFVDNETDYTSNKGPKWVFYGFPFSTSYELRLFAQDFYKRKKALENPVEEHEEEAKAVEMDPLTELQTKFTENFERRNPEAEYVPYRQVIEEPSKLNFVELYGTPLDKNDRHKGKKKKNKDYLRKYDL